MKHLPTTHGSKMSVKSGLCGTSVVRAQNDIMTSSKNTNIHAKLVVVIAAAVVVATIVVEVIAHREIERARDSTNTAESRRADSELHN